MVRGSRRSALALELCGLAILALAGGVAATSVRVREMENCGSDQMVPGTHDNTFPSSSCVAMADGKSQMWHCDVVDGKLSAAQTVYTDIVCTDVEHVHGVAVHQTFHLEDAKYGKAHCFTIPGPGGGKVGLELTCNKGPGFKYWFHVIGGLVTLIVFILGCFTWKRKKDNAMIVKLSANLRMVTSKHGAGGSPAAGVKASAMAATATKV